MKNISLGKRPHVDKEKNVMCKKGSNWRHSTTIEVSETVNNNSNQSSDIPH